MERRLVERGVRFVQIYHRGWDVHSFAPEVLPAQAKDVDRAAWALIQDLKERGLFDDTLVIWGGEFGRTSYSQGKLTPTDYGRDHSPALLQLWMAGGGVKGGVVHGETDDFSYNIVKDPVHIRDYQATLLRLFGRATTNASPTSTKGWTPSSLAWSPRKWSKRSWRSELCCRSPKLRSRLD